MSDVILSEIFYKHASTNTKYHAVHAFLFLGFSVAEIAKLLCKTKQTVYDWIKKYHVHGSLKRISPEKSRKFSMEHRLWIKKYVDKNPLAFLYEIKKDFRNEFKMDISISTIYKILILDLNYTKKKVERRAIQIRFDDICRYTKEINQIEPIHERLIFLDETSMDNRDMLRKRGWFLRNSRPTIDGQFTRSKRISILAFIGVKGIIEAYDTENTFNRTKFFTCLRELVNSRLIRMNSVLIMDGAKIHLDPNIVNYLRSVGLFVLFLPSYCPFFNPIEILFSRLKGFVQKNFKENSSSEAMVLNEALVQLQNIDLTSTYQQCGYMICGRFDPSIAYNHYITVQNCEQRADDDSLSPE